MNQKLLLSSCALGLLLLAACNSASSASNAPPPAATADATSQSGNQNSGGGQRGAMTPQDMQKYLAEANAASDKTIITKEQFQSEMQTLRQAQMAKMQSGSGGQPGYPGNPRFGSGSRQGQNFSAGNRTDRLATATTFWKYTDPMGSEVLLALDNDGKIVMKWPPTFGGRRGFGGGQPPANPSSGQ